MDSLQIAVAAYIAEHGSIDGDTYQALTDLYTTEISASTVINANAERAKRTDIAYDHYDKQQTKDSSKYADETSAKELNTKILSIKKAASKMASVCEKVSKLKPVTAKTPDSEWEATTDVLAEFSKTIRMFSDYAREFGRKQLAK